MQQLTVEQLIQHNILFREEPNNDTMSSDGFTSYLINGDYAISITTQGGNVCFPTYIQLVQQDNNIPVWVLHTNGFHEPEFVEQNTPHPFSVFTLTTLTI